MSPTGVWRPLLGCAVAALVAGCASQSVPNVAALNQATVLVEHAKGHGTGAIIGPNQVLTAYHVVADAPVQVEFFDGPKVGATVRWYDETLDLALIDVAVPPGYRASELACHRLSTGQHLVAVGHPMRDRWVPRDGRLGPRAARLRHRARQLRRAGVRRHRPNRRDRARDLGRAALGERGVRRV
jgi:hypothetical protein